MTRSRFWRLTAETFLGLAAAAADLSAQILPYGDACPGTVGTLAINAGRGPVFGERLMLTASGMPNGAPVALFVGFSKRDPGLDLGVIGMPGCSLYNSADVVLPMRYSGGPPATSLPLPFPCFSLFVQAVALDPGANALGVVTSGGATVVVDPVAEVVVQRATPGNIVANSTFVSDPSTDGEPGALLFSTPVWNPGGVGGGVYNNRATGVSYSANRGQWAVFNQDLASMPTGAAFNVLLPNSGATQFVVTANAGNTLLHQLWLDHHALNSRPGAKLFVTPNRNPGGGAGVYNNTVIGVWYETGTGRWAIFNQDRSAMPIGASFNVLVADDRLASSQPAYEHPATFGSIASNYTRLDHPQLNGNPDASLLVTQRWRGVSNPNPIGVFYDSISARWAVFNQNLAPMPLNAVFNVLVGESGPRQAGFVHEVTASNVFGRLSRLSHARLDGNPDALVFCTQNWNPGGGAGVYNDHPVAVVYGLSGGWAISNEDIVSVPLGASFNVLVPNTGATQFVAAVTSANRIIHRMSIDHPSLNGNPDATIFVMPRTTSVTHRYPVGTWYNADTSRWEVFNQGRDTMRIGVFFNILVADEHLDASSEPFVHIATAANSTGQSTYLDHPELNGDPSAELLVTQRWESVYNDHTIGVWYDNNSRRWAIFNQDLAAMPTGAKFNVLVTGGCRD